MQFFYAAIISAVCYSCFSSRELQAEMVYATLVKVEEVSRYSNIKQKVLTWQTAKAVTFVTFETVATNIPIGTQTRIPVQK